MAKIDIYERYNSKAVAKARKEQIEREYAPQGYGTVLRVVDVQGQYIVQGFRYDTCD